MDLGASSSDAKEQQLIAQIQRSTVSTRRVSTWTNSYKGHLARFERWCKSRDPPRAVVPALTGTIRQ